MIGFLPPEDSRIVGTISAVEHWLMANGLVRRHATESSGDGFAEGRGVFLACSLMMGRRLEALGLFERLLGLCNNMGLLSEKYDPTAGQLLGSFPQALSHAALINTTYNLIQPEKGMHEAVRAGADAGPNPSAGPDQPPTPTGRACLDQCRVNSPSA